MARGFSKSPNLTKNTLLKIAGTGAAILIAASSPYFLHQISKTFFKDVLKKAIRARAKKLAELQKRKLVSFKELSDGQVKIELSKDGKLLVRQYKFDEIKIAKTAKWDGWWRVIIYDIPNYKRQASNAFREKLVSLGLFKLQKSVWISAYDCLPQLEFLCTVFEIDMDRCVLYFKSKEIPLEVEIRKFFSI